jgi:hypothetical protein
MQVRGNGDLVTPPSKALALEIDGTRYRWRFGDASFEVDGAGGARVTSFSLGGENILTGPEVNALNFGSTFWTSPQEQWGWPPPVEIDSEPYAARALADGDPAGGDGGAAISFVGRPDPKLGIAATKTFSVDAERAVVTIAYALTNLSPEARTVAPWEISRHRTNGLTFFPIDIARTSGTSARGAATAMDAPAIVDPKSNLAVTEQAGAIWFDYDAAAITDHQKLFARGAEGWIAHADVARRLLLVKTFPQIDPSEVAPGEAAIEVYADPNHTYVEVEQQGAYRRLDPGQRLDWIVTWCLRRLPTSVSLRAGNPELVAASRSIARG